MIYLVLAVVANVLVSVLLKVTKTLKAEVMVLFNYASASLLTLFVFHPNLANLTQIKFPYLFLILGILLPSGFIIMARAVKFTGIARADSAARLSLFLPIVASFLFLGQKLNLGLFIAISLAFLAIFCLVYKKSSTYRGGSLYLFLVWIIYGSCDIIFKLISKQGGEFSATLFIAFILAFVLLFSYLKFKDVKFEIKAVLLGLLLGVLNFLNIVFYIKAHQTLKDNPSLVFTAMNIGVICVSLLVGSLVFKEQLNRLNFAGILLGIISIMLLMVFG
ncbi:EamA family transporter [Campylobacter corcagiensis]|uniref:EamA family transporter n=1 Tax=Campylobacter corcagiensis TaxID=1448857 RepID=A0A7M1LHC7_9BACT|nr:EamA family transporter [Campylobacter corcagiensis]QKF65427.1 EamA/RhaT family transporter [Campylobacter corcagiensis]QOQ87999.1 EamA family transporter [Campylobacter corcagiensis]